jgi:uncharacterized small protein (DUF1192 family)
LDKAQEAYAKVSDLENKVAMLSSEIERLSK